MGFEKLCKDYISILANIKFGELHDVQQKLKIASYNEFTINTYRYVIKIYYIIIIYRYINMCVFLEKDCYIWYKFIYVWNLY